MKKRKYKHISKIERYEIKEMLGCGFGISYIAEKLNRSKGGISMEIKRNTECGKYMPCVAEEKYRSRLCKMDGLRIEKDPKLQNYIIDGLINKKWSPDAISGRLKVEGKISPISHESIYKFIYESPVARSLSLYQYLPTRRLTRLNQGSRKSRVIENRVSIHKRPEIAKQKIELGHFEADLTFHKGNQSRNIGCMVDKFSQKVMLVLNKSKHAEVVTHGFLGKINTLPKSVRKTLTLDNGTEFSMHTKFVDVGLKTFFCDPYRPRQKALVEKMNSLIHRILPKTIDINKITQKNLDRVAEILNNMPRKILGYKTPNEIWNKNLAFVQLAA